MKILAINQAYYNSINYQQKSVLNKKNSVVYNKEAFNQYYQPIDIVRKYSQAQPFKGINAKGLVKQRGIFMHITSLPGTRSFCGQFGDIQTTKFINWLAAAKQTHWIMNPLNALENHLCPYSAAGRYSRNKFIVNLNKLTGKEYGEILKESELPEDITTPNFTLDMLEKQKNPRFKLAFERFRDLDETYQIKKEYNKFLEENDKLWLDDYANYDIISKRFGSNWHNWSKKLQTAPEDAKKDNMEIGVKVFPLLRRKDALLSKEEFNNQINLYKFEQFLYDKQYHELVEELNSKGIRLILDLPIGVSAEGVDTWGKKNIFLLDENFYPTRVSGCPSEGAYKYTQVWNHALYDYDSPDFWDYQESSLRQLLKTADLRLDHFVGYINRAAIPTAYEKEDGTILRGMDIFKPKEQGGMGVGFFKKEWIENIDQKKSPKGENVFDLFVRIARELGKNPEDTYILESFGPLAKTPAYKKFEEQYGKDFVSQRVPIAMGIAEADKKLQKMNSIQNYSTMQPLACLTGNHDMPSLKQYIDKLTGHGINGEKVSKKVQERFKDFCRKELKLTKKEMENPDKIFENAMKWHYTRNVKQVQTTIQDALGIYYRPNIPGFWNGMLDKYLMKPTPEGLLSFWSTVFPKDFLERDNVHGINPGYKNAADKFVQMMNKLFPEE